jgi:hypothetical protein
VESSSLGSMGAPERLDDPIDTPMESHEYWNKEEHKTMGVHPRMVNISLRDMTVDGWMGSFGCTGSMKGCDSLVECDDL